MSAQRTRAKLRGSSVSESRVCFSPELGRPRALVLFILGDLPFGFSFELRLGPIDLGQHRRDLVGVRGSDPVKGIHQSAFRFDLAWRVRTPDSAVAVAWSWTRCS